MSGKHAEFVHLHVHTQNSLLDGMIFVSHLVKAAREFRMPAVAITDHGQMHGVIDFYQQAEKAGVKPIIGCELYVATGDRREKSGGRPPIGTLRNGWGKRRPRVARSASWSWRRSVGTKALSR